MTGNFPPYRDTSTPERTYAVLTPDNRRIITEHGEIISIDGYDDWTREAHGRSLITLANGLANHLWLRSAIEDDHSAVLTRKGNPSGIWHKIGHSTAALIPASAWGVAAVPGELSAVRAASDALGVGDRATPSSAGLALMNRLYPEQPEPALRGLPLGVWQEIRHGLHGGRADLVAPAEYVAEAWELDMRSAYPWAATSVPNGAVRAVSGRNHGYATYLAHCEWRTPLGMTFSPLPERHAQNKLAFPTSQQLHAGMLWSEEIAAGEEAGCDIRVGRGSAWPGLTSALSEWSRTMFGLRRFVAPSAAGIVKGGSVAALGRLGMDREQTTLTGTHSDGDTAYVDDLRGPNGWWLHRETNPRALLLAHVASYIHMRVRMALYRRALVEHQAGQLVSTNFDALVTLRRPPESETEDRLGAWRSRRITNVRVDHARHLIADGVRKTPGVRRRTA